MTVIARAAGTVPVLTRWWGGQRLNKPEDLKVHRVQLVRLCSALDALGDVEDRPLRSWPADYLARSREEWATEVIAAAEDDVDACDGWTAYEVRLLNVANEGTTPPTVVSVSVIRRAPKHVNTQPAADPHGIKALVSAVKEQSQMIQFLHLQLATQYREGLADSRAREERTLTLAENAQREALETARQARDAEMGMVVADMELKMQQREAALRVESSSSDEDSIVAAPLKALMEGVVEDIRPVVSAGVVQKLADAAGDKK